MISFPPCKINLGLRVLYKRDDGYHALQTVFYPIPLNDVLELQEGNALGYGATLKTHGLTVPGDTKNNLILKAYDLLAAHFKLPPVHFELVKNIPMGAGLGGGSSDGAHALMLLNNYFGLNLSEDALKAFALQLGSDCPFFIIQKPCLGEGRGEILTPLSISLKGYWLALVKPDIHVSTALAFSGLQLSENTRNAASVQTDILKDKTLWKDLLLNDFEESVFKLHPILKEIKLSLYENGAFYASMSGSGATVFGLYEKQPSLRDFYKDHFYFECQL